MNMLTRAQARTAAQQEEADRRAEELYGENISSWENIALDQDPPRVPDEETEGMDPIDTCGKQDFVRQQKEDPSLREYWIQARDNTNKPYLVQDGILMRRETDTLDEVTHLIVVPDKQQRKVFKEAHGSPLGGHFGLVPLPVISTPWDRVAFNVVGPLPKSRKGYRYILTSMDYASRYPEAIPLKRIDAVTVAEAMVQTYTRFRSQPKFSPTTGHAL